MGGLKSRVGRSRAIKVALLGAGSAVFARKLVTDILCIPGLEEGVFALVDVEEDRLALAEAMAKKTVERAGRRWEVQASLDRREVLPGSDYVINLIEVGGPLCAKLDYEIPLKYGVDQCIGDTIGPGGLFRMLRTGPVWLEILRDIERICPQALVLNYSNPLSAMTLLALRATRLNVVGLCHSVQHTARQLADYLEVAYEELRWRAAGINHMSWYLILQHEGEDLYPRLLERAADPLIYEQDPVRFEILRRFGAFVSESSGHFSEYVPYFRRDPRLIARYTREGKRGESGFYARTREQSRVEAEEVLRAEIAGHTVPPLERSDEYVSIIIEARETAKPAVVYGNLENLGLVANLPQGGCVEVPILVDGSGIMPLCCGKLPIQLAALNSTHMYVHELMVEAVLRCRRSLAVKALTLDPLTSATCSLDEIERLFDEMWEAEQEVLPRWGKC